MTEWSADEPAILNRLIDHLWQTGIPRQPVLAEEFISDEKGEFY